MRAAVVRLLSSTALCECSAYNAAYRRTQRSSLQPGHELVATWRWPTSTQRTCVNSCILLCAVDGYTINVVVVVLLSLLFLFLLLLFLSYCWQESSCVTSCLTSAATISTHKTWNQLMTSPRVSIFIARCIRSLVLRFSSERKQNLHSYSAKDAKNAIQCSRQLCQFKLFLLK